MTWQRTISMKALEKVGGTSVKVGESTIFIAFHEGKLYAINGVCSHAKCILGILDRENTRVRCQCHDAEFELSTGNMVKPPVVAQNAPMEKLGLSTYPVREENGFIEVEI